jgi:hypothetical protein
MNTRVDTERILDAFLAPEADRLPDRVIEATLDQLARTRQRRALRVPWRFPTMPAASRSAGIAAVVLVAVVGAGGLIYFNSASRGAVGGPTTTPTPTAVATPVPSEVVPGISDWTPYTSKVYGFQMRYPSDWTVHSPATRAWKTSDGLAAADSWPYADVFANPERVDGDSIGIWVWDQPAGQGADIASVSGLKAWARAFCTAAPAMHDGDLSSCQAFAQNGAPMCLVAAGDTCRAAILVVSAGGQQAYFADRTNSSSTDRPDRVRVVSVGRPDDFPAASRYGGSVRLLKSILTTMDVVTPQAGQVPEG